MYACLWKVKERASPTAFTFRSVVQWKVEKDDERKQKYEEAFKFMAVSEACLIHLTHEILNEDEKKSSFSLKVFKFAWVRIMRFTHLWALTNICASLFELDLRFSSINITAIDLFNI